WPQSLRRNLHRPSLNRFGRVNRPPSEGPLERTSVHSALTERENTTHRSPRSPSYRNSRSNRRLSITRISRPLLRRSTLVFRDGSLDIRSRVRSPRSFQSA